MVSPIQEMMWSVVAKKESPRKYLNNNKVMEAVRTNILGSQNTIKAAIANKVSKIICLGTNLQLNP